MACVTPPVKPPGGCSFLGLTFECAASFDHTDESLAAIMPLVHFGVMAMLLFIAFCNLVVLVGEVRQNWKQPSEFPVPWLRLVNVGYPGITAFFALFRYEYQLGQPLVAGAAIHNWFEWAFISYIFFAAERDRRFAFTLMTTWIWFVVTMIAVAPLEVAIVFEQSTGILLDFWLPVAWYQLWKKVEDQPVKNCFLLACVAHTVHLFLTILPLVFENFLVGQQLWLSHVLEAAVLFSAPLTHTLYTLFTTDYQRLVIRSAMKEQPQRDSKGLVLASEYCMDVTKSWSEFRQKFIMPMVTFAIIGLIPLLGYQRLVPACVGVPEAEPCAVAGTCPVRNVTGPQLTSSGMLGETAVAGRSEALVVKGMSEAFERRIRSMNLLEVARQQPTNVYYSFLRDEAHEGRYVFEEAWASQDAMQHWIDGYPKQVFDVATNAMLVGGQLRLDGPFRPMEQVEIKDPNNGAIHFTVNGTCSKMWADVGDWSNCIWVEGCVSAVVHQDNPNMRTLTLQDGKIEMERLSSMASKMMLAYWIHGDGYRGELHLTSIDDGRKCDATYFFESGTDAEERYKHLYQNRVPYLQKVYGCNEPEDDACEDPSTPRRIAHASAVL